MSHILFSRKIRILIFGLFFFGAGIDSSKGQDSFGLQFFSHETMPEKRSSLDLSSQRPFCFSGQLDLSFDLSFAPNYNTYFGYIFRLINENNENIDLLYDQKSQTFRLVAGETFTDVNFQLNDSALKEAWIPLRFSLYADGSLTLTTPTSVLKGKSSAFKNRCFKIIFGVVNQHNYISTDLPPMRLRNIGVIIDNELKNFWPLHESAGEEAIDSIHHQAAKATNPSWINPKHTNWTNISSLSVQGRPGIAFDKKKEALFIVGIDSLYKISIATGNIEATPLTSPHSNLLAGNQAILNPFDGNLYNFYADELIVSVYDTVAKRWTRNFEASVFSTERWHLNKFITNKNELLLLGGYGQQKYKNVIQRYDLSTRKWDTLKPTGDFYSPRYLSALGSSDAGDTAYILGGYGSNEGSQLLNPRYLYDLLIYDVHANRMKKVYDLPTPEEQFVFANSLIIDNTTKSYYGLIFPNNRFSSELQLIRGSLNQPQYVKLGTTFPFSFLDVRSFADLFYCPRSKKLVAITLYGNKDNYTDIKIYSIDFPVNETAGPTAEKTIAGNNSRQAIIYGLIAAILAGAILYLFILGRKKRNRVKETEKNTVGEQLFQQPNIITNTVLPTTLPTIQNHQAITPPVSETIVQVNNENGITKSRISLFGNFEVVTDTGVNITNYFTPLLKELFLLILIDTLRYKKGVTSEKMNDILWKDKDIKDAKNNRSVNLVKLKNILEKLGNSTISRRTTSWMFEFDPELIDIDYLEYLQLSDKSSPKDSVAKAIRLSAIVKNGSFLSQTDYEWLNDIKAEISNFVTETLVNYAETLTLSTDAEKKIEVANEIFQFDELNEHALIIKCKSLTYLGRHALAKNTFDQFIAKYKHIYGTDFEMSFSKILNG